MSVWGAKVSTGAPITVEAKDPSALSITHAALASGSEGTLYLEIDDKPYAVAILTKEKNTCSLDINIWTGLEELYTLSLTGKDASVHLTGYYHLPELPGGFGGMYSDDDLSIDDDEMELQEVTPVPSPKTKKKKEKPEHATPSAQATPPVAAIKTSAPPTSTPPPVTAIKTSAPPTSTPSASTPVSSETFIEKKKRERKRKSAESKEQSAPAPEPKEKTTSTPELKEKTTPTPEPKEKTTPTPEPKEKSTPVPPKEKSTPVPPKEKSTPVPPKEKSTPVPPKEKSTPEPELKEKSTPAPETKEKSTPAPETKEKSTPTPEPTPEVKTRKGKKRGHSDDATTTPEKEGTPKPPKKQKVSKGAFKCKHCERSFNSEAGQASHTKDKHPNETK